MSMDNMKKDKFTEAIHDNGWTVAKACDYWGIEYSNFRRLVRSVISDECKNEKKANQLISMCRGLEG